MTDKASGLAAKAVNVAPRVRPSLGCLDFLVEFLHTNSHENTMRKTMKIFTYMDSMSQGVPKSVQKRLESPDGLQTSRLDLPQERRKGREERIPFRSNCADVHIHFCTTLSVTKLLENLN